MNRFSVKDIAYMALIAALAFVSFNYLKIDVFVGGDKTSLHFSNVFVVLGALLLGGWKGGFASATGLTLADLTTGYAHVAPRTFFLKMGIALVTGFFAHRVGKINTLSVKGNIRKWVLISSTLGMAFNVIFDPLVGYFYSIYILGISVEPASLLAKYAAGVTFINAILTVFIASGVYFALRDVFRRNNPQKFERRNY